MKATMSNTPCNNKVERETIHSGHFMISTFEAEEAQDDLDDSEIKMLDPEDPSFVKPGETNTCMEVQLYVPRKVTQERNADCDNSVEIVTSHLEIETSLTKLFKCMNLAYSQKLTSPKWNHFKGVRLRWKDKIRLNNVIWRCWHMQFILKRKTLVCQFASPLDVDVHSNPESVVLEGKYWKRQLAVIKAEYRKWRRNYKSTIMGFLTCDTKSELDFLDWSPITDKHLIANEDWTTDTLFSAINVPFPFPDSREIARGAGIADFIQPSLGPLQPNLDDIDLTFVELLQNTRLPSVPEEGSEEILKNVDYNFSDICTTDQMNGNDLINVSVSNALESTSSTNCNMTELGTPLNSLQYVQMEQDISLSNNASNAAQIIKAVNQTDECFNLIHRNTIMNESSGPCVSSEIIQQMDCSTEKQFVVNSEELLHNMTKVRHGSLNDFHVKKSRISKISQRPFRREPHNYDKAQPTLHQTNTYQQILAEQQRAHQYFKQEVSSTSLLNASTQQQNTSDQLDYRVPLNNSNNNFKESNSQTITQIPIANGDNKINHINLITNNVTSSLTSNVHIQSQQNMSTQNVRTETPSTQVLPMFDTPPSPENNIIKYKLHPHMVDFKKAASTGNYFNLRTTQCQAPPQNTYMSSEINAQEETAFQFSNNRPTYNGPQQPQFLPNFSGAQIDAISNELPVIVPPFPNLTPFQRSLSSVQLNTPTQQIPSTIITPQVSSVNQSAQSVHAETKEMYRSNSLPLNITLPKITQIDQYTMSQYHQQQFTGKNGKNRLRSNSIHHQHYNVNSPIKIKAIKLGNHIIKTTVGMTTSSNTTTQLQSSTSESTLNTTKSQILTTQPHIINFSKQPSTFDMGIRNIELSTPHNKLSIIETTNGNSAYVSLSSESMDIQSPTALESEMNSRHCLKHSGEIQDQQQPPYKSPKKSKRLSKSLKINSLSAAADNTNIIKYPIMVPETEQVGNGDSSSSSTRNQIYMQSDIHHELNSTNINLSPTAAKPGKSSRDNIQQRRFGHIHAEQKRRYNIKSGFDQLHDLIPQLQHHNVKLSKAAMLQKGVEHIKHLRNERNILKQQMDNLKLEREALNNSLTHLQSVLPANGSPITRQGTETLRKLYEEYVLYRSKESWKFWILGLIMEPLLTSYTTTVSNASVDELRRTAFLWVDQHCSLVDLRPAVSNKLKYLSMKTDLLSDPPSTLKKEVEKAMTNSTQQHPNLYGT